MADKHELTEEQFKLLKAMCSQRIYALISPENITGDTPTMVENREHNRKLIGGLVEAGFAKDVTADFEHVREKCRETGERLCEVFILTQSAIDMFTPPDGMVN